MRQTVFLLIFVTGFFIIQAQTNVDSLVNVLNTEKMSDDNKLQLYWDILLCYWSTDLDKNIYYATEALNFAAEKHNDLWSSKLNRAITISYYRKGEYDLALQSGEKAIQYAVKAGNKREENASYLEIGNMYLKAGNREMALKYYTDILPALEEYQQFEQQTSTLINLAILHAQLHNNKRALQYLRQAEVFAEKHDLIRAKMFICSSTGSIYAEEQKLDSAVMYVHKSYEISQTINDKAHQIICTQMLAGMYGDLKDLEKAKKYADECLDNASRFGDKQKLLIAWITIAKVNFCMKHYVECDAYAYKAWEADSTDLEQAASASDFLCRANIFIGNPEKADYFFKKYQSFMNKISDKSLHDSLLDMEIKYETEKKETRIATLEKEKQLYVWLGIAGGAVLLLAFGVLFYRHRLNVQKVKQLEQEKQLIATQAILDGETAERSRLARDLHDGLGGMLSVVKLNLKEMRSYSILDGPDVDRFKNALGMLDQSITELRRVAHHMMPESLMRYGLKVSIEDFCRAIPNAHFQYYGSEERLEDRLEVVLYRCAYELVNNAVKYAEATTIHVQLMIDEGLVSLTVQDNGIGFDPEKVTSGSGLDNIHTRVSAYNGKMTIHSSPGNGTEVSIEIEKLIN